MTLTADHHRDCERYCFRKAWRLRLRPKASKLLIQQALELMALPSSQRGWGVFPGGHAVWIGNERWLTGRLAEGIELAYRRPAKPVRSSLVILLLLQLLPVIAKWVIEWWLNREKEGWKA